MCKDWKQHGCNHHFPELNKKGNWLKKIKELATSARIKVLVAALTLVVGAAYLMQINV